MYKNMIKPIWKFQECIQIALQSVSKQHNSVQSQAWNTNTSIFIQLLFIKMSHSCSRLWIKVPEIFSYPNSVPLVQASKSWSALNDHSDTPIPRLRLLLETLVVSRYYATYLVLQITFHRHQFSHSVSITWCKTDFIVICDVKKNIFFLSGGDTHQAQLWACWLWHYHSFSIKQADPTLLLGSGEVSSRILHQGNIKQYLPTVTRAVYWIRGAWDSKFCAFNSILSFNRQTSSSDKLTHGTEWYYASIYTHTHTSIHGYVGEIHTICLVFN